MTFRELRNILNELRDPALDSNICVNVNGIVVDIECFEFVDGDDDCYEYLEDGTPYLNAKPGCRG